MQPSPRTRLATWQAVHQRLLQEDAQYRSRHTRFLISVAGLSLPLMATYGFYFKVGFTSFAATLTVIVGAAGATVVLSLRQFLFMHRRIGRETGVA